MKKKWRKKNQNETEKTAKHTVATKARFANAPNESIAIVAKRWFVKMFFAQRVWRRHRCEFFLCVRK
jgi:hypothetical protein